MSKIEVDTIAPQSGTTVTLGESGDTITVPSGATLDTSNSTVTLPDGSVSNAKLANSSITLNGNSVSLGGSASIASGMFRNIIINGDMSIAQRSTSVSGITGSGYHTIDRMDTALSSLGTWTQSQSTDVPSGQGFATSLKMDCTTADASPSASDLLLIRQKFEGQNLQYLKKGTSNAESLTCSFWVKSNKTGTYICELRDIDNGRIICKSYTIDASNTWEKKTITFAGDTTGAFDNNNADSFNVSWWLGAGSSFTTGTLATSWQSYDATDRAVGQVNLADNTANEWYITGVQLEAGTTASDFEFLPYDINKNRCERYFLIPITSNGSDAAIANGTMYTASDFYGVFEIGKGMRAAPTLSAPSGTNFYGIVGNSAAYLFNQPTFSHITNDGTVKCRIDVAGVSGKSQGQSAWIRFEGASSTSDFISADAEL